MSTIPAACPHCDAKLKVQDTAAGKKIRCPKCKEPFTVPADDDEPAVVAPKATELKAKRVSDRADDDDDDDDRPRRKGRTEEDDDEDRPRRKKRKKPQGNPALLWGLIGGGAGLVLIGAVVAIIIVANSGKGSSSSLGQRSSRESQSSRSSSQSRTAWSIRSDAPELKPSPDAVRELQDEMQLKSFWIRPPKTYELWNSSKPGPNEGGAGGHFLWFNFKGPQGCQLVVDIKPPEQSKLYVEEGPEVALKSHRRIITSLKDHDLTVSKQDQGTSNGFAWHFQRFNGLGDDNVHCYSFTYVCESEGYVITIEGVGEGAEGERMLGIFEASALSLSKSRTGAGSGSQGSSSSSRGSPSGADSSTGSPVAIPELKILKGHGCEVTDLAFSKDGKTLVSCGDSVKKPDKTIVWDVTNGTPQATIPADKWGVWSVAISADGSLVATGAGDVYLWNAKDGQKLAQVGKDKILTGLSESFSPDGKTLALGTQGNTIVLWNVAAGALLRELRYGEKLVKVGALAYSLDGNLLAADFETFVKVWDISASKVRYTIDIGPSPAERIAFSPDGQLLATGSYDGTTKLWDMTNGKEVADLSKSNGARKVMALAFTPDGAFLLVGKAPYESSGELTLWDVKSHRVRVVLSGTSHTGAAAISGDGKLLAAGETDNSIKLWELDRILQSQSGN